MNRQLVSIILPVYKAERFIRESLNSLIKQTYTPIEIVIVYDPSPDNTLEIVKKYYEDYSDQIKLIIQKNKTCPSIARNIGIKHSNGRYVAFCDADDLVDKDKIREQVRYLNLNPHIGVVYTDFINIDEKGQEIERIKCPNWDRRLWLSKHFICFSSLMVRREVLEEIKAKDGYYFDERLPAFDDYDLLIRLSKITEFGRIPQFITYHRIHSESLSTKTHEMNIIRAKIELKHGLFLQFVKSAFFIIPKDYILIKIPFLNLLYNRAKSLIKTRMS